jgi:hypothetical protein
MNIFFDVDYTILGYDGSLRPGTRELIERLYEEGHQIYIWSGTGVRTDEVLRLELDHLVSGVYQKPLTDFDDGLGFFGIPVVPDFVVDDYPRIVKHFGGVFVTEYEHQGQIDDQEMTRVYAEFSAHIANRATEQGPLCETPGSRS